MEKGINSKNRRNSGNSKFSKFASFLAGALFFMNPSGVEAQNITSSNKNSVEVSTTTILDRLGNKVGASLPDEYAGKLRDFVTNNPVMKTRSASEFTENFIIEQMKNNRGIEKDYQYTFMRFAICEGITENTLYDRLDDENEYRANAYEKALTQINDFYKKYEKGFKTYIEEGINEYEKNIENSKKNINEYKKNIENSKKNINESISQTKTYITNQLDELLKIYNLYKKNPNNVKESEIKLLKEKAKGTIESCKEYGIDHKAKLSPEMLKFYGVE